MIEQNICFVVVYLAEALTAWQFFGELFSPRRPTWVRGILFGVGYGLAWLCFALDFVHGKPDDLLGERVVADIVVNNNFCKHEFMRFCSCSFGQVKISEVNQVRQIPKTYNGKIKRVKQYYTVL